MNTPVHAKVQNDGNVYCYDANGNYVCGQMPHTGKAVSAHINGSYLMIQTDNEKSLAYEFTGNSIVHRSTR